MENEQDVKTENGGQPGVVVDRPGPFVCEWCGTIFKTLDGTRIEDGEIIGVGYCSKCKCKTWTSPISE